MITLNSRSLQGLDGLISKLLHHICDRIRLGGSVHMGPHGPHGLQNPWGFGEIFGVAGRRHCWDLPKGDTWPRCTTESDDFNAVKMLPSHCHHLGSTMATTGAGIVTMHNPSRSPLGPPWVPPGFAFRAERTTVLVVDLGRLTASA